MNEADEWKELVSELKTFIIWILSSLFDAGFMACWVIIQWLVNDKIRSLSITASAPKKFIILNFDRSNNKSGPSWSLIPYLPKPFRSASGK
jgi:hypothetical protein